MEHVHIYWISHSILISRRVFILHLLKQRQSRFQIITAPLRCHKVPWMGSFQVAGFMSLHLLSSPACNMEINQRPPLWGKSYSEERKRRGGVFVELHEKMHTYKRLDAVLIRIVSRHSSWTLQKSNLRVKLNSKSVHVLKNVLCSLFSLFSLLTWKHT